MLHLFGDTHGSLEMHKVLNYLDENNEISTGDHIVILGDAGIYWDGGPNDGYTLHLLDKVPCQVLWIDGNHENFELIKRLPITEMYGGKVQLTEGKDHIVHLMRGEIYEIEGHSFFVMGGGYSIDKPLRKEGVSWWSEEMPSDEDYLNAYEHLKERDFKVDYVLTHSCPRSVARLLVNHIQPGEEVLQDHLEEYALNVDFKDWYFGHWDIDRDLGKFHSLYFSTKTIE